MGSEDLVIEEDDSNPKAVSFLLEAFFSLTHFSHCAVACIEMFV